MSPKMDRRSFLKGATVGGAGLLFLQNSSLAFGTEANDKLNIAVIGAGGMGGGDCNTVAGLGQNIVALCDVDDRMAAGNFAKYPNARRFKDYRVMLDKMHNQIDAVTVGTPDHTHAPASIMAMQMGKHCFCQKPLTHSLHEAKLMRDTANRYGVATQMGNQGTAGDGLREAVELIQAGILGEVKEVHVWSNRPVWPQACDRPKEVMPIPKELDWDLWLGTAPYRPFNSCYMPFAWRGWKDFGTGALGDMGCHTWNLPFMALDMRNPISVVAEVWEDKSESYPAKSIIHYVFPARGTMPPLRFTWYDGSLKPDKSLMDGRDLPGSGCLIIGSKGKLFSPDDYGSSYELLPKENFVDFKPVAQTLPRAHGQHHAEWISACKGGPKAMSNFDYASKLTETILLGVLAINTGKKIYWDPINMKAIGCPEADQFIAPTYRKGWKQL